MDYTQTLNTELNENIQALELMFNYGNVSQYLDVIHDLMNIHHLLHSWTFDRDAAAELIGSVYIKYYDFYKEIRNIPGVITLPFAKAPDHILISNLLSKGQAASNDRKQRHGYSDFTHLLHGSGHD